MRTTITSNVHSKRLSRRNLKSIAEDICFTEDVIRDICPELISHNKSNFESVYSTENLLKCSSKSSHHVALKSQPTSIPKKSEYIAQKLEESRKLLSRRPGIDRWVITPQQNGGRMQNRVTIRTSRENASKKFDAHHGASNLLSKVWETRSKIASEAQWENSEQVRSSPKTRISTATFRSPIPSSMSTHNSLRSAHYNRRPKITMHLRQVSPAKKRVVPQCNRTVRYSMDTWMMHHGSEAIPSNIPRLSQDSSEEQTLCDKLRTVFLQWASASSIRLEPLRFTTPAQVCSGLTSARLTDQLHAIACVTLRERVVERSMEESIVDQLRMLITNPDTKTRARLAAALCLVSSNQGDPHCIRVLRSAVHHKHKPHGFQIEEETEQEAVIPDSFTSADRWAAAMCLAGHGYSEHAVVAVLLSLIAARVKQIPVHLFESNSTHTSRLNETHRTTKSSCAVSGRKKREWCILPLLQSRAKEELLFATKVFEDIQTYSEVELFIALSLKHNEPLHLITAYLSKSDWRERALACWLLPELLCELEESTIFRVNHAAQFDWNHLVRLAALRCLQLRCRKHTDKPKDGVVRTNQNSDSGGEQVHSQDAAFRRAERLYQRATMNALIEVDSDLKNDSTSVQMTQIIVGLQDQAAVVRTVACHIIAQQRLMTQPEILRHLLYMLKFDSDNRVRVQVIKTLSHISKYSETGAENICTDTMEYLQSTLRTQVRDEINPTIREEILSLLLSYTQSGLITRKTDEDRLADRVDGILLDGEPCSNPLESGNTIKTDEQPNDNSLNTISHRDSSSDDMLDETTMDDEEPSVARSVTDEEEPRRLEPIAEEVGWTSGESDDEEEEPDPFTSLHIEASQSSIRTIDTSSRQWDLTRLYELFKVMRNIDPCPTIREKLKLDVEPIFAERLHTANAESAFDSPITVQDDIDLIRQLVQYRGRDAKTIYSDLMRYDHKWRERIQLSR